VAVADAAAGTAPAQQHSVWTSVPAPLDAAAATGAAAAIKQPAFRMFETESPGVGGGAAGAVNAVDWRQEWNSL
jgi:hypothetical protein